jgi:hypothetical protein
METNDLRTKYGKGVHFNCKDGDEAFTDDYVLWLEKQYMKAVGGSLTESEIKIAQIQSTIKKLGYQWQEHQFNDGFDEVYIEIAKDKSASAFDRHKEDAGWGRMGRLTAWRNALEWATQRSS